VNLQVSAMKKAKDIHNLDSLEREIYRLKLEAKSIKEKMDHNLEQLQDDFSSMAMNSFFCRRKNRGEDNENFFESILKNEKLNKVVDKVTDHIANRAAESIDELIDKIFHKKKHRANE
jgi:hypothetical protein